MQTDHDSGKFEDYLPVGMMHCDAELRGEAFILTAQLARSMKLWWDKRLTDGDMDMMPAREHPDEAHTEGPIYYFPRTPAWLDEGDGHRVLVEMGMGGASIKVWDGASTILRFYDFQTLEHAFFCALLWQKNGFFGEPPDGWLRRVEVDQPTVRRPNGRRASTTLDVFCCREQWRVKPADVARWRCPSCAKGQT